MRNRLAILLAAGLALAACGPSSGDDDDDSCSGLAAGDLVISEIQADLAGTDDGKEWIEIYNATGAAIDLTGLTVVHAKDDATGEKTHAMLSGEVAAGGYFVIGAVLDEFKPSHVDYGLGADLGAFRNTNGLFALRCGGAEVDTATYDAVDEDASLALNGNATPDYIANDNAANWCSSVSSYLGNELGTPGAANDACGVAGSCNDGGTARPPVAPVAGDLVITEFMANPSAVGDTEGEWFEVYVANAVDLNGLQFGKTIDSVETITSPDCLSFPAGSYVLFAKEDDPLVNGGMDNVDFTIGFSLSNTDSSLVVGIGGAVLDEVTWASVSDGASTSLDPDFTNPTDNDTAGNFCPGIVAYGDGDLGTPGEPNDDCVFAGECVDLGTPRTIDRPAPGDVVISEIMANPATPTDGDGEWFEIYVVNGFDLNELQLGRTAGTTPGTPNMSIESVSCLPVTAGSYVLFARNADPVVNGGMDNVDQTISFTLANSGDQTLFVSTEGTLLDQVTYNGTTDGVSDQLDAAVVVDPNAPTLNDDPLNWCDGTTSYGSGGAGTPGAANLSCP